MGQQSSEGVNPKVQESVDQIDEVIQQTKKKHNKSMQKFKKMRSILYKFRKRPPKSASELRELFSLLCFNNLGFCCGPNKKCFRRNAVLEVLGIDLQTYAKAKAGFAIRFVNDQLDLDLPLPGE